MTKDVVHCEAKLHALRKTQDGVVVSFNLHPQEIPDRLMVVQLGTRFMLALAEIGDDERPAPALGPGHRPLALSSKAALLCKEVAFQDYCQALSAVDSAWWDNASPEMRENATADFLRAECGVSSRRDITPDSRAAKVFERLETEYFVSINKIAAPR